LPGAPRDRALRFLKALGKRAYGFQADGAVSFLEAVQQRSRVLVQSPTGTGKTLIAHLGIALLAGELGDRFPRVLIVVPSRPLLAQHALDAGWLRRFGLAVNSLGPHMPPSLFVHLLKSFGVMITTPVTLRNRTSLLGDQAIAGFDCVIFDEIDTYLTVEELEERQDVGPALQLCLKHEVAILGFTATHLSDSQVDAWRSSGFEEQELVVPREWMPFTPTRFLGVGDAGVIAEDAHIRERMRKAYSELREELGIEGEISWATVKTLARVGNSAARALLLAMTDRLLLFESAGTTGAKYRAIIESAKDADPTLILTRYIETARILASALSEAGVDTVQVDGEMSRLDIERGTAHFRERNAEDTCALVMTRDLGGRGLDFPSAARVILVSPRSNYQTVAQELARIRSRNASAKDALIYYYDQTEEAAKGRRLGANLSRDKYGGHRLFEVTDLPPHFDLDAFESRNLRNEESLIPGHEF
jgi:superfamily II DNA or RNA helicase